MVEGQGTTFAKTGLTGKVTKMNIPGWSREEIEKTNLANTDVKTFLLGKLRKINDLKMTLQYKKSDSMGITKGNSLGVLTLPEGEGPISFWCDVKEAGDVELETDKDPTQEVVIKITNLDNSGNEVAPF